MQNGHEYWKNHPTGNFSIRFWRQCVSLFASTATIVPYCWLPIERIAPADVSSSPDLTLTDWYLKILWWQPKHTISDLIVKNWTPSVFDQGLCPNPHTTTIYDVAHWKIQESHPFSGVKGISFSPGSSCYGIRVILSQTKNQWKVNCWVLRNLRMTNSQEILKKKNFNNTFSLVFSLW